MVHTKCLNFRLCFPYWKEKCFADIPTLIYTLREDVDVIGEIWWYNFLISWGLQNSQVIHLFIYQSTRFVKTANFAFKICYAQTNCLTLFSIAMPLNCTWRKRLQLHTNYNYSVSLKFTNLLKLEELVWRKNNTKISSK